jgi:iron complex transport system substrate-binding protein
MRRFHALLAFGLAALALAARAAPGEVRVVSQTVGSDELLLALAEPSQIAALSHLACDSAFSAAAEAARPYPRLHGDGDAESVLRFAPTLVLFADYSRTELVTQVRRAGVRVLVFDRYHTLEDSLDNLRALAREIGAEAKADALAGDCLARVRALRERLAGVRPARVIAPSVYGMIPGAGTTFQDLCDHAAAENLAATLGGLRGHQAPPNERMLSWPIDCVVVAGDGDAAAALEPLRGLSPYQFMPAVREGRAVLVAPWQLSCVSHHRVEAYEHLARALHPEVFP